MIIAITEEILEKVLALQYYQFQYNIAVLTTQHFGCIDINTWYTTVRPILILVVL